MLKLNREVFRCKEDKDKIREKIFKFLEERGVVWKRILEDVIINCRNKSKQCLVFKFGEICKSYKEDDFEEQICLFFYVFFNFKKFDLFIEYDMLVIELEDYIYYGVEDVRNKEFDFDKEVCFIFNELDKRYKVCNWLLEDFILKEYYNVFIFLDFEMVRDLMRKLRYFKLFSMYVKKRMVFYFKSLYDEMEENERKDNIKVFVMICFVNYLLNLEMKFKFDDVMLKFEDLMNRECFRKEGR